MIAKVPASFLTGKKPGRFPRSAAEQRAFNGIVFDSKLEMARYAELRQREKLGIIFDLVLQPEYRVEINGGHFCKYTADFRYLDESGELIIEDVKGRGRGGTAGDAAFRLRKKAAELFFGIKITMVTR